MRNNGSTEIQWQNGCLFWRFDSLNSHTLSTKCTTYWRAASKGRDEADWLREGHRVLWSTKPCPWKTPERSDFSCENGQNWEKRMRNFQKLLGRCPRPRWGAYSAPQTPSWIGLTSLAETTLKGVLRTPLIDWEFSAMATHCKDDATKQWPV